jgi:glycosyltransferase involved in cell wall biosynthesis
MPITDQNPARPPSADADLTVAVCVYNGERFVRETLDSLDAQTYKSFHLLVIDDASTDSTARIVRAFIDNHRFASASITTLPINVGLAGARKVAEGLIATEYVLFFDADDVAHRDMVGRLHEVISNDVDCMGVSSYCRYIDPESRPIGGGIFLGPTSPEQFRSQAAGEKLMFLPPATMFRLPLARTVGGRATNGFPEGRPRYQDMCEDLDLWTRMSDYYREGKYLLVVPEVLFDYRKHVTSVSSSSQAMNDRMRHIKSNLKRRRRGQAEQSFVEFKASVSGRQELAHALHDHATDYYKRAGFYYMQKQYPRFLLCLVLAAACSPKYVFAKLRNNVIRAR